MAKKAMINKANREPKYAVRRYNRCRLCGRPARICGNFRFAGYAFATWPTGARFPELIKPAGEKEVVAMVMTDPVADMLTRIRNANIVRAKAVEIPASNMKKAVAEILKAEGYIDDYEVHEGNYQGVIKIYLKYNGKQRVISGLKKISKPGLRVYVGKNEIPKVLGGLGVAVLSTSKGIMTDKTARKEGLGGEVLCYIW